MLKKTKMTPSASAMSTSSPAGRPILLATNLILLLLTSSWSPSSPSSPSSSLFAYAAPIFFDPVAIKYSCVNDVDGSTLTPGSPLHLVDVNTSTSDQTILLKPLLRSPSSSDGDVTSMCVLHKWTSTLEKKINDGMGFYHPLGRSSPHLPSEIASPSSSSGTTTNASSSDVGYGDWTRPPGLSAHDIEYRCGSASNSGSNFVVGEYLCEVTLPTTSRRNMNDPTKTDVIDLPYYLTYYVRNITVRNELSRFLQKNTFGPTNNELDDMESEYRALISGSGMSRSDAMAKLQRDWIVRQMDPSNFASGEYTSLRKYWRKRLNPRKEETYRIGESGPHPCEKHSRWRKFAFTAADVQNSKMLRWGTFDIGGTYQTQRGHRVTVETVTYTSTHTRAPNSMYSASSSPSGSPLSTTITTFDTSSPSTASVVVPADATTTSPSTSVAGAQTDATSSPSVGVVGRRFVRALQVTSPPPQAASSTAPSSSSASTTTNILVMGDMEGTKNEVLAQFLGTCTRTLMDSSVNPTLVYSGAHSLKFLGGRTCFYFRPIAPTCGTGRILEQVRYGDVFRVSAKVRIESDAQVFQIYTGHYHESKGDLKWTLPVDDSHMISRTLVPNRNEWVTIEATHRVGDDWIYRGNVLEPVECNHYHLRFRVPDSGASFYVDDVTMTKISTNTTDVPTSGFFVNPNFEYSYQYWTYSSTAATLRFDPDLNRGVMLMRRGSVLSQNILKNVIPGKSYRFSFLTKIHNVSSVDMIIVLRVKFNNKDLINGPCNKAVCNIYARPLNRRIVRSGDGAWQEVVTDVVQIANYTEWNGSVDFVSFQMTAKNLIETGEYSIAGFQELGDDYTDAPSTSFAPSSTPTTLVEEHTAYVVSYAGEVRTVINYPFQIDNTGEVLAMNGTREYQLCDVDEVEGRKAEFPNRLNFFINGACRSIRHGNPTVNLDPKFINMTGLHILDLSNQNATTLTPINTEQTYGGDWLLKTPVQDEVCATFPSPYDNDYRGADPTNPNDIPSRFQPDKPVFAKLTDGTYAIFDSRLILHENSLENPVIDGGGNSVLRSTLRANRQGLKVIKYSWAEQYFVYNDHNIALCSNEMPNFLNQDKCVLSYEENTCVKEYRTSTDTLVDVVAVITFDNKTLASLYNASRSSYNATSGFDQSKFIYAVGNLRWDDSIVNSNMTRLPCSPGNPVSRWIPRPDLDESTCINSLTSQSNDAFVRALESSNDENQYLRDIYLWNDVTGDGCDEVDYSQYGMLIMTEKEGCWENVHPDLLSIYDFTGYEAVHPVNTTNIIYINNWTAIGIMQYPDYHPMSYFDGIKLQSLSVVPVARYSYASTARINQGARYGDSIILDQFADQMKLNIDPHMLASMAKDIAKLTLVNKVQSNRGGGTLVCGSPNEVAPDPTLDDFFDVINRDLDCIGCMDSYGDYSKQKATVWAMNVLEGEDQLCQRMAWSLYEFLNVGAASNPDNTESNLYTYDIMLRHCFGNYFDILKEMTYSPKMAEQFSFAESTSTRIAWDTSGELVFPDENYAREVMQLFTVGLHELNPDGTDMLDDFGRVTTTYTNKDILSNARVLTGFTFTARRGNVEELFRSEKSRQDPLRIEVDKHDFFPKSSIDDGWIGDRYPLCVDLPKYHFLKIGAKFVFRGDSSLPMKQYNPDHWDSDESIKRFVLSKGSDLYQALCNQRGDGSCNFANTVRLDSNLQCFEKECRVDDLGIVQVQPGAFYEYIRQPCVDLSFYKNPKKVITGYSPWMRRVGRRHTHAMCADPRSAVAARSCCVEDAKKAQYNYGFEYHGERVTHGTNMITCTADGGQVCDPNTISADNPLVNLRPVYNYPYPSQNTFFWTDASCTQMVKVRQDGMIAIINKPAVNPAFYENTVPYVDSVNSLNYFSVPWEKDNLTLTENYPTLNNTCGNGVCTITNDNNCMCSLSLSETPAFNSLPSRESVLSLKVGAYDPATFSDSAVTYQLKESSANVEAFVLSDTGIIGDTSTIFKVVDEFGETVFFKNLVSIVTLGNTYSLRNPPSFMSLLKVDLRDAEYEVDNFLTNLIRYRSTAPFIARSLIQYHGISNPSPGFVQRVSQAFITGSFSSGGITFGNNKYGNLQAVAASISLDPESLTPVVDEDPISGNIREPLLKVMHILRSLSFQRRSNVKFRYGLFENMAQKIGQMVFDPPDQFSFFAKDYMPPGVFAQTGLVSPEAELLSMSSVVGITNGLISLVDFGLTNHYDGFGPYIDKPPESIGDYSTSVGFLGFSFRTNVSSVSDKIDELSTLITAGRLSAENKQVMLDAHAYFLSNNGTNFADDILLKLLSAAPEFHTSNTVRKSGSPRSITQSATKSSAPYKAIVYVNLNGGVDSFNILTPGPFNCPLYDEYMEARGKGSSNIGLKADEILSIDGSSAGISQCDTLGVNKLLSAYKDIFDEGSGIFFANMGHLHKPVTKENWLRETRTDLFSHHTMRAESHHVDAFREGDGPGVLGRMLDILEGHGHAVSATAMNERATMIDGSPKTGRLADVMSTDELPRIRDQSFLRGDSQQLREFLSSLHAETTDNSGVFGNAWSQAFVDVWNKTDSLAKKVNSISLATPFSIPPELNVGGISSQLELVARLIRLRDQRGNGINRDVFYCEMGGFDAHFQLAEVLKNRLPSLNYAVSTFWAEIKAQGLANNVVVIQGSEFGRTISANSNFGSDHGWGGNYFMFGGDVKGGKIMGKYPSFGLSDPTNIGRGRVMPTTSWEALFYGVSQWMGISLQDQIDYVLPNSQNFGCNLYTDYDLFKSGSKFLRGCGGASHSAQFIFQVPEIRMLTGEEQKEICKTTTLSTSKMFKFDRTLSRCYIGGQVISESVIAPGKYDVKGMAVINFDGSGEIPAETAATISVEKVQAVAKAAAATASDFVIAGALAQSEAPSSNPSSNPTISFNPSSNPTLSLMPTRNPSSNPSSSPTISHIPSSSPTISLMPTKAPTSSPSTSFLPSASPTTSHAPTTSIEPTPSPTERKVFENDFFSRDIGAVAFAGQSLEVGSSPGLYTIQGSGYQIYGTSDSFHYMYIETSGDATFTVLVEGMQATSPWAKVGVMFRSSLSPNAGHYSVFMTKGKGIAQQYRDCAGCNTTHYGTYQQYSSVWLRVVKQGNILKAFYKPSYLEQVDPWYQFGYELSMDTISSNGYYLGVAVSGITSMATCFVSNIQLTRTCSSKTITKLQCDQASNCELGQASGSCYRNGEVPTWESFGAVSSVFDLGSEVTVFGCVGATNTRNDAVDRTTNNFVCLRNDPINQPSGIVIRPSQKRLSIAESLRIYSNKDCSNCDPVSYTFEGRLSSSAWVLISQGDLPWKDASSFPRNSISGVDISSTYTSGDISLNYAEVSFYNHDYGSCGSLPLQSDYRGNMNSTISGLACQSWSAQSPNAHPTITSAQYPASGLGAHNFCRNPNKQPGGAWCYTTNAATPWESCDVPVCADDPSTLKKYVEYKISFTTRLPSSKTLTFAEIEVPGLLAEEYSHVPLNIEGNYVPSVLADSSGSSDIKLVNGYSSGHQWDILAVDGSTEKFEMYRDAINVTPGIIASPSHGMLTVVTGLRIYTANNNPGADPMKYRISGRMMSGANVKNSVDGKCWSVDENYGILMGNAICSASDPRQRFFMNALGEIRVMSHPGYCLDHRYGFYPSSFTSSRFIPCFSEDPYYQSSSWSYVRDYHKFRLDTSTGQLASPANTWSNYFLKGASESCLQYNNHQHSKNGQFLGGIYPEKCVGSPDTKFIFDGGVFSGLNTNWTLISEGSLPWISEYSRNPLGIAISSNYDGADESKNYMEVQFYANTAQFYEYKIDFTGLRNPASSTVHFAEIELPGLIIGQTPPPTSTPTKKPTKSPTRSPTTYKPTRRPTSGDFIINRKNRCGTSELDARESCGTVCEKDSQCPTTSGKKLRCYGVFANYCDSIPKRIFTDPKLSRVARRCGLTEIYARTFCTQPCTSNSQCTSAGETCLEVYDNYCGSSFTEVWS